MAEINRSIRYRVNVSQTSTGKKSWDSTVELSEDVAPGQEDPIMDKILLLSDMLTERLERRYPPEITEKKGSASSP